MSGEKENITKVLDPILEKIRKLGQGASGDSEQAKSDDAMCK
jgi:hypothetical protein